MKTTEFSNNTVISDNIDYFVQLIRIAMVDGTINNDEMALLHNIGKKTGFSESEITNLIETTSKATFIPVSELSKRFEQVYHIVKMTLADGLIDKAEMRLASTFAANSGFKESEIPNLLVLLISGIKQGVSEKDLFETYLMSKKS